MDLAELSQRAREGKSLYGDSDQPMWVRAAAHSNSAFSQLKFRMYTPFWISLRLSDPVYADAFPWCEQRPCIQKYTSLILLLQV